MTDELTSARYDELEAAGLCFICEHRRDIDAGGVCVSCRLDIDASSSTVVDPVETALSHHMPVHFLCREHHMLCRCGWSIDSGPAYHRQHMAEMIYQALGLPGPSPWDDGPLVEHPIPQVPS